MPLPTHYNLLASYLSTVFIETGTYRGDGIDQAAKAGFQLICSADISPYACGWAGHRFQDLRGVVEIHCLDSREFLRQITGRLSSQATFWLDAHFCGAEGGTADDEVPLLDELNIIARHGLNNHHILIDDVRLFGKLHFPTMDEVMRKLRRINPDYKVSFAGSEELPNDILIASL